MPMGIPQSLMYGYRGQYADGAPARDRGTEQANTYSGNPNMPIFNQPSPNAYGRQSMPVDPSQVNPTQAPGVGNAGMDSLGNMMGGSVTGGRIRPNPNVMAAMSRLRGINPGWSTRLQGYGGGYNTGIQQNTTGTMGAQPTMPMWQGHQVTPDQLAQIQATNANTARLRATYGQQPPPTPTQPATY
jgi:hypothetical protein